MTDFGASVMSFRSVSAMIRMFDYLYKMGVRHAHDADDEIALSEFLQKVESPDKYGLFTEKEVYDWARWRSRIFFWTLDIKSCDMSIFQIYLKETHKHNTVPSCFYPISYLFYIQGIMDRIKTPISDATMTIFESTSRIRLEDCVKNKFKPKRLSEKAYISMVQSFGYELSAVEDNYGIPKSRKIGSKRYIKFAECFWTAIASYRAISRANREEKKIKELRDERTKKRIGVNYGNEDFFD